MLTIKKLIIYLSFLYVFIGYSQSSSISLYSQFSGRYDYTTIGNTLNTIENNTIGSPCTILTSSSASLSLSTGDTVEAAYLYWAGSGSGDFDVTLNGQSLSAQRTFNLTYSGRTYFSGFTDVTTLVQNTGSGTYTLSDLDLTTLITTDPLYCNNATNFAGWAIVIVLQNDSYQLRDINIYDGFEIVPSSIDIVLNNLQVYDTQGSKIGFLAWEGDALLATETLTINGTIVDNLPNNPANNVFNGTNSFTGISDLYNMDIDYYNLENYISTNDTSLSISLTSYQDVVIVNNIVTVLNSFVIPDAAVQINSSTINCDSREAAIDFSVTNYNSSGELPTGTTISIYVDGQLLESMVTSNSITPDEEEYFTVLLSIPNTVPDDFTVTIIVDENNLVDEYEETNNSSTLDLAIRYSPEIPQLANMTSCDLGHNSAIFNLESLLPAVTDITFTGFFTSEDNAMYLTNEILTPTTYTSTANPQTIYFRYDNDYCYSIGSFELSVYNCPPIIPQGFSPNGDTKNDYFNIQGLWTVFDKFDLKIYNRYGSLLYQGNQNTEPWNGIANTNMMIGKTATVGTYFYVLRLEDELFNVYTGWVYLNK
ncbi:hypothetical protein NBRC110019_25880 [Neptunitalea chrysea]|uniref:CARDB domain-containing protein n=1 Tax=Neptunitalea chrysea TaxID=1647581 RepID=A0A9W6B8I7_9FLAO|nr:gliding motility-associated C-terminal domain-containing protein [Neptunitalea chrysea]GLB53547.1 hypothetical protein NBRC110019_25880 [Neptunitalea chrysea]